MIQMSFEQFEIGDYDEQESCLYLIRDKNVVLYIGISNSNIWNRWFANFEGRMPKGASGQRIATDNISRRILENLPQSEQYIVELYTLEEGLSIVDTEIKMIGYCRDRLDSKDVERLMINKFSPEENVMHNHPLPIIRTAEEKQAISEAFNRELGNCNNK